MPYYRVDSSEQVQAQFGATVRLLVLGISRMEQIRQFSEMPDSANDPAGSEQMESLRKMLLAMVEDIRVVLIRLALRTQTLRTLSGADPEHQLRIAHETQRRAISEPPRRVATEVGVGRLVGALSGARAV